MRIYYDRRGRRRGYSRSGWEELFWNWSLIGLIVRLCLAVFLVPLYYVPRAVWRARLPQ